MEFYFALVYCISFLGFFLSTFYALSIFSQKRENRKLTDKIFSVSIVIPAYNEEACIARTIESALGIDYPKDKFEIIVIDDGSKDKTYAIARKFESRKDVKIRVLTKQNGGKGSALNLGIKKAKGEIIITMDADTFVEKGAVREMMAHFYSEQVASVTPAMIVYKPKTWGQRVQQIEYALGVFLRKAVSVINAVHVTPGAFSAYRKSFFEKHGGYEIGNITEDLEMGLRIQKNHFIIENAPKAVVYTIAPPTFRELIVQRRRWYAGLIRNLIKYYSMMNPKYGLFGVLLLPMAVISVLTTMILTIYAVVRSANEFHQSIVSLAATNFKFNSLFEFSRFTVEHYIYTLFSQPIFPIFLVFIVLLSSFVIFSKRQTKFKDSFKLNLFLFIVLFSLMFTFWWIMTFAYMVLRKDIVWRKEKNANQ